jgi:serine/threonine protein kinase
MPLTPGRKLGVYEILDLLGSGGMGEVYRARDTKLGRDVALKVLPEPFAQNKERLARFEREARLLASLNHPNVATIHGLEESEGLHFLVLELVPGETLAERIKRGPIPVEEALPLFGQMAEALEAAHDKGVIHRDLKPANVKVTPEGKVKVLDFGLARAMAGDTVDHDLSQSPTMTRDVTQTGVILGTAAYMSPEQARGKTVDKRTDIWAFGCMLFEALTGKATFLGDTASDTIARILEREPEWSTIPEDIRVGVRSLLHGCLQKDARRRLRDVWDVRVEIERSATEPVVTRTAVGGSERRRSSPFILGALVSGLVVGASVWIMMRGRPPELQPLKRFSIPLQSNERILVMEPWTVLALSPDGRKLVYDATREGSDQSFTKWGGFLTHTSRITWPNRLQSADGEKLVAYDCDIML